MTNRNKFQALTQNCKFIGNKPQVFVDYFEIINSIVACFGLYLFID